jgi:hypothetical protein
MNPRSRGCPGRGEKVLIRFADYCITKEGKSTERHASERFGQGHV